MSVVLEHSELWRIGFHVVNAQEGKGSEVPGDNVRHEGSDGQS